MRMASLVRADAAISVARLPASVLRELAALAEQREQARSPWRRLSPEAFEEGVAILASGRPLSWPWWISHLPPRPPSGAPPLPDTLRCDYKTRRWADWELVAAAVDMAADIADGECSYEVASDVLAQLAAAHGLDVMALKDAYMALRDAV
jgi:hypothetical protein